MIIKGLSCYQATKFGEVLLGTGWQQFPSPKQPSNKPADGPRRVEYDRRGFVSALTHKKSTAAGKMSVTRTMVDGLNVFTVTSDPHSLCPPLCQMLQGLCHTPACCSVSQALKRVQNASLSLLGALHFVVGLLTIGLTCVVCSGGVTWDGMGHTLFPFWIGGVFMLLGLLSILSEKCPTPCLVLANVILNVIGLPLAIIAIVLYCISMANIELWWFCHQHDYPEYNTPAPSADQKIMMERCLRGKDLILTLMLGMHALLIILTVLELCVIVSCIVLGVKGLRGRDRENMNSPGPEPHRALLEEANTYPPA